MASGVGLGMTGHPTLLPIVSVFCITNLMTKIFIVGIVTVVICLYVRQYFIREVFGIIFRDLI